MTSGAIPIWLRPVAALACVAAALSLIGPWRDERRLHRGDLALAAGRSAEVVAATGGITRRSAAARAAHLQALAALQQGDVVTAEREISRAVAASPEDWSLRLDHAVLLRRLGRADAARRAYGIALGLNPRLVAPLGFAPRKPVR